LTLAGVADAGTVAPLDRFRIPEARRNRRNMNTTTNQQSSSCQTRNPLHVPAIVESARYHPSPPDQNEYTCNMNMLVATK
jgi:hypothetical protein